MTTEKGKRAEWIIPMKAPLYYNESSETSTYTDRVGGQIGYGVSLRNLARALDEHRIVPSQEKPSVPYCVWLTWRVIMAMGGGFDANKQIDPALARQIEVESQKAKFTQNAYQFTDVCWDKCVDKISNRMDRKAETCLTNCVERFLDTTNFVIERLGTMGSKGQ